MSVFIKNYSSKNGRRYNKKKKCKERYLDKNSHTKNRKLVSRRNNSSEEYKLEWAVSETAVTDILEEIKQFDKDIFDAIEDDEIENETRYTIELSSNVKKIVMKIRKKTEKLNSNTTNTFASNRKFKLLRSK